MILGTYVGDMANDKQELGQALATIPEIMKYRTSTKDGREKYKLRTQSVEPVFGIIKAAMGFRQFSLRGLEKVNTEWTLVTLAYNFKRLFSITNGKALPEIRQKMERLCLKGRKKTSLAIL